MNPAYQSKDRELDLNRSSQKAGSAKSERLKMVKYFFRIDQKILAISFKRSLVRREAEGSVRRSILRSDGD